MALVLLTRYDLIQTYPVPKSRPGLRAWIKKLGFPAPRYANHNTPLWSPETVDDWFASRPNSNVEGERVTDGR